MIAALGWIVSIISVVGIGGFIALLVFAPVLAQTVVKGVQGILESILSTRLGVGLLVGAVCLIAGLFCGDYQGAARVRADWDEANAIAAAKARAADDAAARTAEATDRQDAASETKVDTENQEARNAYIAELEKRVAAACTVNDAGDIERLRRVR